LANIPIDGIIYMRAGFIDNVYLINNTIYGTVKTAGYLIRYENGGRPDRAGLISGSINLNNNTFYNVVYSGQMGNYTAMSNVSVALRLSKNIFVDCGSGTVVKRLCVQSTNMVKTFVGNCYWFDGAFPSVNEIDPAYGDKSGSGYGTDPLFTDPANGNFTVGGTTQLTNKTGDPRWLPAQ